MTCIVGIEAKDRVYIGADSAGVSGDICQEIASPKVFRKGQMVIGHTHSFRLGQALRYLLHLPRHEPGVGTEAYLVGPFVHAVRKLLKAHGMVEIQDGVEYGGSFLMGYRGKLYHVGNDFSVLRTRSGMDAIGAGRDVALGALAALSAGKGHERPTCRAVLVVVAGLCNGVRPPFSVKFAGGT